MHPCWAILRVLWRRYFFYRIWNASWGMHCSGRLQYSLICLPFTSPPLLSDPFPPTQLSRKQPCAPALCKSTSTLDKLLSLLLHFAWVWNDGVSSRLISEDMRWDETGQRGMIGTSVWSANHISTEGSTWTAPTIVIPIDPWGIGADGAWTEIPSSLSTEVHVLPLWSVPIPRLICSERVRPSLRTIALSDNASGSAIHQLTSINVPRDHSGVCKNRLRPDRVIIGSYKSILLPLNNLLKQKLESV